MNRTIPGLQPCPVYGTTTAYNNRRCRCTICRNNQRLRQWDWRLQRRINRTTPR